MSEQFIHQPIIPQKINFNPVAIKGTYDLKAIAVFTALGFFLEKDTYYNEQIVLQPCTDYKLNDSGKIISENKWWQWHYSPRDIQLKQATEEFAHLFENIIKEQTKNAAIILPLSGGIDSRTLAAALKGVKNVKSYSYEFHNGIGEIEYAKSIAGKMGFSFEPLTINEGYLWNKLEAIAKINNCYSEFTNPRQMAFVEEYGKMGNLFLLGHWGDVLFDNMNVSDNMSFEEQAGFLTKKIVKKGGVELATMLWKTWELPGNFMEYLNERIGTLLGEIKIDNANSRLRAFKSLYWAPRWTTTNMEIFSSIHPIAAPYYHDDICKFICTVPENILHGRQIQIEYLKLKTPSLASIPWQSQRPFNLYNYEWNKIPWNLPYRLMNKSKYLVRELIGKPLIQRNWELQFLGEKNDTSLRKWILESESLNKLVPLKVSNEIYNHFKSGDRIYWSHPVSMLLTLSVFRKYCS